MYFENFRRDASDSYYIYGAPWTLNGMQSGGTGKSDWTMSTRW